MNEVLRLALAMAAGCLLGAIFFGGLWWTVRRSAASPRPALWFVASLLLRMSIAFTGFYAVGREHWQPLLLCLLGFVLARLTATWLVQTPTANRTPRAREASHAP